MYLKKEFVHQVGKEDYYYIRMHGQQNIKKCPTEVRFFSVGFILIST